MVDGKSPQFRILLKWFREARFRHQHPDRVNWVEDLKAASREKISRRDFLRNATVAATALSIPAFLRPADLWARSSDPGTVAILGGGVAGLTTAYRLAQRGIRCEIFEAANRWGGRMHTVDFPGTGMFAERGGEFVDTNQEALIALCEELGVGISPLKESGASGQDMYFFDGHRYGEAEVIEAFGPFAARLVEDLEGLNSNNDAMTEKARRFDQMSLGEYLRGGRFSGTDKWLIDLMDVAYTGEYGLEIDEQSALNFLTFIDPDTSEGFKIFGESDEAWRIRGGSSALIAALEKRLTQWGIPLRLGHRLERIHDTGTQLVLSFQGGAEHRFDRVVCTLPFSVIRKSVPSFLELELSPGKARAIRELGYGTNAKVIYGFEEKHWLNGSGKFEGGFNGSVFTDRSVQCLWDSSRGQVGDAGILTSFLGGKAGEKRGLTRLSLTRNFSDLDRIFPGATLGHLGETMTQVWAGSPLHQGSYSCPLVGQYSSVLPHVASSELGGRLVFAGEHTSGNFAGFMCGAVESGNLAADAIWAATLPLANLTVGLPLPARAEEETESAVF